MNSSDQGCIADDHGHLEVMPRTLRYFLRVSTTSAVRQTDCGLGGDTGKVQGHPSCCFPVSSDAGYCTWMVSAFRLAHGYGCYGFSIASCLCISPSDVYGIPCQVDSHRCLPGEAFQSRTLKTTSWGVRCQKTNVFISCLGLFLSALLSSIGSLELDSIFLKLSHQTSPEQFSGWVLTTVILVLDPQVGKVDGPISVAGNRCPAEL